MNLRNPLKLAALVLCLGSLSAMAAEQKFAYVDTQRVLEQVADAKAARTKLQSMKDQKQKEIDSEQEKLRKEMELLQRQSSAMSDEVKAQKGAELQRKIAELAKKYEASQMDLMKKEQDAMQPILAKIDGVISKIAEREGLDMVFDKKGSGLVFAQPHLDITNEVMRMYGGQKSAGGKKK